MFQDFFTAFTTDVIGYVVENLGALSFFDITDGSICADCDLLSIGFNLTDI